MTLAEASWDYATTQLDVREVGGNNRGPDVERYQHNVGGQPGEAWCAAFAATCVQEGAKAGSSDLVGPPQFKGSRSALRTLEINPHLRISHPREASGQPFLFAIDHGGGKGHIGLGRYNEATDSIESIEGNTNAQPGDPAHDREGGGVYLRHDRKVSACCGFIRIG